LDIGLKSTINRDKNGFLVSIEIGNFFRRLIVFDFSADKKIPPVEEVVVHDGSEPRGNFFILKERRLIFNLSV
jgi:hypothetical protein